MRRRTALVAICIAFIFCIASDSPVLCATRHVVILFDERLELPGPAALDAEFTRTLISNSGDDIEIYRETMDLSRFDSDTYRFLLRNYLRDKYADKKINVAVAAYGPVLDFLSDHGGGIFPGTPIVFCAVDRRELANRSLPAHIRGVLMKREFAPTLELALGLHPHLKQVVVVAGTSDFDTRVLDQARQEFSIYESRLAFKYLTSLPLEELLDELARLPPETIVLFTTFFQDGAGEPFVPHDVIPLISAAATAPVYGFVDQYLGRGIVGGTLYSISAQGAEAAKLVLQVFAGQERLRSPLLEVSGGKTLFDWRELQRWGITESSLPDGSEVRFRKLTIWDEYRNFMLAVFAVFILQTTLIGWLIYEHRRRQAAEAESLQRLNELARVNRFASAGQMAASLAHEIRQPLAAIAASASAGLNWLNRQVPDLDEGRIALQSIIKFSHRADNIITSVKAIFRAEPTVLTPVNINDLARQVIAMTVGSIKSNEIVLHVKLKDEGPVLVMGNPIQLQQVLLNLITNAIEAMGAIECRPRLLQLRSQVSPAGTVLMRITDSGAGIDPNVIERIFEPFFTTKSGGMGMGLAICKTIIESHGGTLTALPGDPHGMEFRIVLPHYGISLGDQSTVPPRR